MPLIDFIASEKTNAIPNMETHIALAIQRKIQPFGYDVILDENTRIYSILKDFTYCGVFEFGKEYVGEKRNFLSFELTINDFTFTEPSIFFGKNTEGVFLSSFLEALEENIIGLSSTVS